MSLRRSLFACLLLVAGAAHGCASGSSDASLGFRGAGVSTSLPVAQGATYASYDVEVWSASSEPVRVVGVEPMETVGSVRFLGAMLIPRPGNGGLNGLDGFPPPWPDAVELDEAVLEPCDAQTPSCQYRLLLGVERVAPGHGGIQGFRVTYTVGGSNRTAEIGWGVLLCDATSVEPCDGNRLAGT